MGVYSDDELVVIRPPVVEPPRPAQVVNCSLKSAGDVNGRPGMNEVSYQPLHRSITPLDSGSRGGSSTSLVARVPMNDATPLSLIHI